jgi:phosphatidylserine decarboxylase
LETELLRPENERRRVDEDSSGAGTGTGALTSLSPSPAPATSASGEVRLGEIDFSGPALEVDFMSGESKGYVTEAAEMVLLTPGATPGSAPHSRHPTSESSSDADLEELSGSASVSASASSSPSSTPMTPSLAPATAATVTPNATPSASGKKSRFRRPRYRKTQSSVTTASQITSVSHAGSASSEESFERVINVKNCPLCHRPRLNSKAEVDIITHIAVCASQDWNIVDRIVVGNFVTASQAQRKFFTRILSKISSGDYRLGAVSLRLFALD